MTAVPLPGPSHTALPEESRQSNGVHFYLPSNDLPSLASLPWHSPLELWEDYNVRFIPVKSGLSRHVVRFIESGGRRFAIKQTTQETARRELGNYVALSQAEIPSLAPVGVVTRDEGVEIVETKVGEQVQQSSTGYLVTELMDKVIPDSYLFRRAFSPENRKRIWDTVVRLFIQMHSRGVYWGDASLANMLIKFTTERIPELGFRTKLSAVLADAETVEMHQSISDSLRMADVEFFLESMLWTDADLRASGVVRDPLVTQEDQRYVRTSYNERYTIEQEIRSFELVTHIDVDKLLGDFDVKGYGKLLLQHINEHKWYLSERKGKEVPLFEAAEDWYREIFKPVCRIFNDYGVLKYFPDETASTLYVEIMEHKYFMSEREKNDVGLIAAVRDYLEQYTTHDPLRGLISSIVDALTSLFKTDLSPRNIYLE